jgi:hypothetical protein
MSLPDKLDKLAYNGFFGFITSAETVSFLCFVSSEFVWHSTDFELNKLRNNANDILSKKFIFSFKGRPR